MVEARHQSTSATHLIQSDAGAIQAGDWVNVTYSWGTGGSALSINGQQLETSTSALTWACNDEPITLGAGQGYSGDGVADDLRDLFDGQIAEFAIFDTRLTAEDAADLYYAGAPNLDGVTITGEADDNELTGGAGDDTIDGGGGNDVITGGTGDDVLVGGADDDEFMLYLGDGSDTITGGAGGTDQISIFDADNSKLTSSTTSFQTTDWTLSLNSGTIVTENAADLVFSADAAGQITFSNGDTVDFSQLEQVAWT